MRMMPQSKPCIPILITRPKPQADALAQALRDVFQGRIDPIITPLLAPQFTDFTLPSGRFGAVVFTSQTAVFAVKHLTDLLPRDAFCVGPQTTQAARAAGFTAHDAQGDAETLAQFLSAHPQYAPFLHLRGQDVARGFNCAEAIVYTQKPLALSGKARAALKAKAPVIAPIYSPKTAEAFGKALAQTQINAPLHIIAISENVRAALPKELHPRTHIAPAPNADSMQKAIADLLHLGADLLA